MKILSWNIRDAGRTGFKAQLVEIARSTKPDLILLLETKVHTDKASKIIKSLSYENSIEIPTEGLSGGIWLLWNSSHKFQFHFISFNNRFIHGQINDYTNNTAWLCTCVYGYPQQYLQKNLWNQISNLSSIMDQPWLIIGDPNELSSPSEKHLFLMLILPDTLDLTCLFMTMILLT